MNVDVCVGGSAAGLSFNGELVKKYADKKKDLCRRPIFTQPVSSS